MQAAGALLEKADEMFGIFKSLLMDQRFNDGVHLAAVGIQPCRFVQQTNAFV